MSKLLNAEFHRLLHFKLYFIECAAAVLYPLYLMSIMTYSTQPDIDSYLFTIMAPFGYLSAVCVSQFIGTEHSNRTFNNKLFTGHTRAEIFFTQLILHFLAGVNVLNLSVLTVVISGAIRGWVYEFPFITLLGCYLMCVCTIFFITAVSVFVSMLNRSNMASFIILFALALALETIGGDLKVKLIYPEYRMPYTSEIMAGQTEPVKNGLYAGGSERTLYECLLLMNPYAQANYEYVPMYDTDEAYIQSKIMEYPLVKIFLFSAVESTVLIFAGISVFRKKDLK